VEILDAEVIDDKGELGLLLVACLEDGRQGFGVPRC
jgi:hypothetical protein